MKKTTRLRVQKYLIYTLVMLGLYVVQTTPNWLNIFGLKPDLVAAGAVCIAFLEGELSGGLYGVLAGILCDYGATSLFGFHALTLLVLCAAVGLASLYYFRTRVANLCLLVLGVLLLRGLLDYLLHYVMWGYDSMSVILLRKILPTVVYTTAWSPAVYYIYKRIFNRFQEVLES